MLGAHVLHDMACDRVRDEMMRRYGSMEAALSCIGDLPEEDFFRQIGEEMEYRKRIYPLKRMGVKIYGTDTTRDKFLDVDLDK